MAFRPHRFGRYIIVDPIAVGGMAEIYRARPAGGSKDGPDRILIIKKVIANLSQNSEFVEMFEGEIKVTVGLTHPNIVQIYDYGKVEEQLFMAMEYVEGKNLRQFVNRLTEMKSMFSLDMSCYIISQTCHALGYAHSYKDRVTGKHLGIVHRDISPQNVMISYDGAVKLFDFGIAKAKSSNDATRAGVIKGKPSYLAPEQISGEELDGRCDVFALGIVLWELLTAKRLFVAENDLAILRMIQSAKIEPPSTFNPAVPQALDAIVLKSLTRDREKRYQNAEEFQRDLHKFLYSFNPSFNPADLSYYAQELFKKEIAEDRDRLQKYLAIEPVDSGDADNTTEQDEAIKKAKKKPTGNTKLAEGLMSAADFNREAMEGIVSSNTDTFTSDENSVLLDTSKLGGDVKGGTAAGGSFVNRPANMPPVKKGEGGAIPPWQKPASGTGSGGTNTSSVRGTRSRNLYDQPKQATNFGALAATLAVLIGGVYYAHSQGYVEVPFLPSANTGERGLASTTNEPARPNPAPNTGTHTPAPQGTAPAPLPQTPANAGVIRLLSDQENYVLTVNGTATPVVGSQIIVPVQQKLLLRATKTGFAPVVFEALLVDKNPVLYKLEFKPIPTGKLNINTTPAGIVTISGPGFDVPQQLTTPVQGYILPVGTYKLVLEERVKIFNSKKEMTVEVEAGRVQTIDEALNQ